MNKEKFSIGSTSSVLFRQVSKDAWKHFICSTKEFEDGERITYAALLSEEDIFKLLKKLQNSLDKKIIFPINILSSFIENKSDIVITVYYKKQSWGGTMRFDCVHKKKTLYDIPYGLYSDEYVYHKGDIIETGVKFSTLIDKVKKNINEIYKIFDKPPPYDLTSAVFLKKII